MANDASDAVDREAAWLQATDGGLPNLLLANGGPFDVIQSYMPRTPPMRKHGLFVTRSGPTAIKSVRFANLRRLNDYDFRVVVWWPLTLSSGSAEDEQRNLDAALWQVLQRVIGPAQDKTHGGRFLQVAEDPDQIVVEQPELQPDTLAQLTNDASLKCVIRYSGADPDFNA